MVTAPEGLPDFFALDGTLLDRVGLVFARGRVDGIDWAFAEWPNERAPDKREHWLVAADDDGIRFASLPVREGLVGGAPLAAEEVLRSRIEGKVREGKMPEDGERIAGIQGSLVFSLDHATGALREICVAVLGKRFGEWEEAKVAFLRGRLRETTLAVSSRLGPIRLVASAMNWDPRKVMEGLRLDRDRLREISDFIAARPWLARLALANLHVRFSGDADRDQVALLANMRLPTATARRVGPHGGEITPPVIRLLRSIPVDWVPRIEDADEWACLRMTAIMLERMLAPTQMMRTLVAGSRGRWTELAGRIAALHGTPLETLLEPWRERIAAESSPTYFHRYLRRPDPERFEPLEIAVDVRDMGSALTQFLEASIEGVEPGPGRITEVVAKDFAGRMVFEGRGLLSILETSARWHADAAFESGTRLDKVAWEARLPPFRHAATGIEIVPLTDSDQLADEGMRGVDRNGVAGLSHCVGGRDYVRRNLRDDVRILSLRKDGSRLSTVEVDLGAEPETSTLQHRGHRNGKPPEACREALAAYLARSEVHRAFRSFVDATSKSGALPARVAAGTFRDWAPYLAGDWRNRSFEEIQRMVLGDGPSQPKTRPMA